MEQDTCSGTSVFFLVVGLIAAFIANIVYFTSGGLDVEETKSMSSVPVELREQIKTNVMSAIEAEYDAMVLKGYYTEEVRNRRMYSDTEVDLADLHEAIAKDIFPDYEQVTRKEVMKEKHVTYKIFGSISCVLLLLSCIFGFLGSDLYETIIKRREAKTQRLKLLTEQEQKEFNDWKKYVIKINRLAEEVAKKP